MWIDVFLSAIVCAGVIFAPGALVAFSARTRPLLALTLAAPLSVTIVAASSVIASKSGITWGFTPVLLVTALAALGLAPIGVWRTLRARKVRAENSSSESLWSTSEWEGKPWLLPAALGIAAAVHITRLAIAIGTPDAFSQTYDSPFHHNVIALFLERGDASFLKVSLTTFGQENGFYPALWHQLASLAAIAVGTHNTGIVTNGLLLTVTGIVWPLSVAVLVGWTTRSWNFAALGALMAFAAPQMPNHFTWFGVLYPNLLAYAMISFYLAVAIHLFWGRAGEQRMWALVMALLALPGLAIAHPSGAISFLVLVFPILAIGIWHVTRQLCADLPKGRWVWPSLAVLGVFAAYAAVNFGTMRVASLAHMRTNEWYWPALGPIPNGIAKVLMMKAGWPSAEGGVLPALLGVVVIIGAVYAIRRLGATPLVIVHVVSVTLFMVAYSVSGSWRPYIIGMWYSDPHRFASLTGVTAAPLITFGVYAIASGAWILWNKCRNKDTTTLSPAPLRFMAYSALVCFVVAQASPLLQASYRSISEHMAFDTASPSSFGMLSVNELSLMKRLPQHVTEEESIISNPWDGSVFAPAVAGVNLVYSHVAPVSDEDGAYLAEHLKEARTDPHVCEIVRERNITHVLDFGPDYLWNGDPNLSHLKYPGLKGLAHAEVAQLVDQEGNARLLRITACDGQ